MTRALLHKQNKSSGSQKRRKALPMDDKYEGGIAGTKFRRNVIFRYDLGSKSLAWLLGELMMSSGEDDPDETTKVRKQKEGAVRILEGFGRKDVVAKLRQRRMID